MGTFAKDDVKLEPGSEESISTYVFTQTTSGKPKDKTFCKGCGVPLWTVTESARAKGQILLRTAVLDNGYVPTYLPTYTLSTLTSCLCDHSFPRLVNECVANMSSSIRSELKPQISIFTKERPAWAGSTEGATEFETLP